MENDTFNITESDQSTYNIKWQNILLGIILSTIVLFTIAGNVVVLLAFYNEKKLRTVFNLYIVNLAVTDIGVASTAMSFYTIDNILGYWPFGEFMCGFWIFVDYGMTFASVFTLLVISIDRFWSVSWSVHYRTHHNKKKSYICIAIVWITMVILWLPACITDRMANYISQVCIWEPSLNSQFVIVIAVVGHHGPCLVILFCYLQVFFFIRKRSMKVGIFTKTMRVSTIDQELTNTPTTQLIAPIDKPSTSNTEKQIPTTSNLLQVPILKTAVKPVESNRLSVKSEEAVTIKREKRVFVTLSYILGGYVICWVPFHIVFDISAIKPDAVPSVVYVITFWMTYLNSAINPVLYNFSSPDFRQAFRNILCRKRRSLP